jgi:hypothetical protein
LSNEKDLLKEMRTKAFVRNNGHVMRYINICGFRHKYIALRSVWDVSQTDMGEQEYLDCINYLSQKGYIRLRNIKSKAVVELADAEYTDLEALLTDTGIDLMGGAIENPMVDV